MVFFDNYFNSCELLEEMLYRDTYGAAKLKKLHPRTTPSPHIHIIISLHSQFITKKFCRDGKGQSQEITTSSSWETHEIETW